METQESKRNFVTELLKRLRTYYPDATCTLNHRNPFQLLIATILSAQCTDERVNKVTPALFQKYHAPEHFAKVPIKELEEDIRSTGFYRQKAKNIRRISQILLEKYNGEIPRSMDSLTSLPGIGRKTANVVLGTAFQQNDGIAVDTHVRRLSRRFQLTEETDPEKIEKDLMEIVPREEWTDFSHLLIQHGRNFCKARKPLCADCFLNDLCPSEYNPFRGPVE